MTRVIGETGALKTSVETCILDGKLTVGDPAKTAGACDPQATASNLINGALQGAGTALVTGTGVPTVLATLTGKGDDTITSTLDYSAAAVLKGKKVQWTRDGNGSWSCLTDADAKYAPPACPNGTIK
nr:pilin [Variovorax sp. EL159]